MALNVIDNNSDKLKFGPRSGDAERAAVVEQGGSIHRTQTIALLEA